MKTISTVSQTKHCASISCIRLSLHNFEIEAGRYTPAELCYNERCVSHTARYGILRKTVTASIDNKRGNVNKWLFYVIMGDFFYM